MNEINNYESLEDALMFCIRASNKEVKEVACALWPSDRIETTYPRLIDALNPSKRQKLSMNEIIFIMHFCGRYDPLYYMADKCLHERPNPKCVEKEQIEVQQRLESMLAQVTKSYQQVMSVTKQREEVEKIRNGSVSFLDLEKRTG